MFMATFPYRRRKKAGGPAETLLGLWVFPEGTIRRTAFRISADHSCEKPAVSAVPPGMGFESPESQNGLARQHCRWNQILKGFLCQVRNAPETLRSTTAIPGLITTLMHPSFLSRNVRYASGACSKGIR